MSTNTSPFKWSTSCEIACANNPSASIVLFLPSLSKASTITFLGLTILANWLGKLKHPSSTVCVPSSFKIIGFINVTGPSPSSYKSISAILFYIPI